MKGRRAGRCAARWIALAAALALMCALGVAGRWGRTVPAGACGERAGYVALTFDDGPRRKTTQALLDGLARRGVPATFFLIGLKVPGNEDLILRMEEEGHQVGIHAQNHEVILTSEAVAREVEPLRDTLAGLLGRRDFMVRPPYGKTSAQARAAMGAPVILWSVDPEDWSDTDTRRQSEHILSRVKDGDIILLHDVYPSSVDTALTVADALLERGFSLVTVEQLFAVRGRRAQPGEVYHSVLMGQPDSPDRNCCTVGTATPHTRSTSGALVRRQTRMAVRMA